MKGLSLSILGFCAGIAFIELRVDAKNEVDLTLPDGFLLGIATSAYQIEGGWNASGKGESTWDKFVHEHPEKITDHSTGDISSDSYHKYKEDVQIVKTLGLHHYRFSISWTRVLPTGYSNVVNKAGVEYYHNLLDELEANGIEPYVTIYHFDHPARFDKFGGWTNEIMVDLFADYARFVFQEYGHRVKKFITINEPSTFCKFGYEKNDSAPALGLGKEGRYLCGHNVLKAHARAWHIYNDEFRAQFKGTVGLVIACDYYFPLDKNDTISSDVSFQFECGWMAHPIYSQAGDYPEVMIKQVGENSRFEGRARSRLPKFSKEWIEYIKGTSDFFGLNHYTTFLATPTVDKDSIYYEDTGVSLSFDPVFPNTDRSWKIVPQGFGDLLRKIKGEYSNPPIYILENGVADSGIIEDVWRIVYLYGYMKEMLMAIKRDGCDIRAYTVWSLLDNFEWPKGYTQKFGIVHVDFNDPNRTRTLKASAYWVQNVARKRKLKLIF